MPKAVTPLTARARAKVKMGNHRYVSNGETLAIVTEKTTAHASTTTPETKKGLAKAKVVARTAKGPARRAVSQAKARTKVAAEADPRHQARKLSQMWLNCARPI